MNRADILGWATELTAGDRNDVYGDPTVNHRRIAALWSAFLETPITAHDVAVCQILVKVGRLMHTPDHADSHIDIAGYAAIAGEISCAESAPSLNGSTTVTATSSTSSPMIGPATRN